MRLVFYLPKFSFFSNQCCPLQNSSFGKLHTHENIVPTFACSARSLLLVWYSTCLLQSEKKASVLIFSTESAMSKISFVLWSQGMNHGFFNTILRPRSKVRRGTLWATLDQRKLQWANRRSNQCWFVFLFVFIERECKSSFFLNLKISSKNVISGFYKTSKRV